MNSRSGGGPIGDWEKPWLIQRLNRPHAWPEGHFMKGKDNPFAFGGGLRDGGFGKKAMDLLRPIFSFDYMGSAEFELGAVPKAIQSMIASMNDLCAVSFEIDQSKVSFDSWESRYFKPPVKGVMKSIHLIAKVSHHEPAEKYILSLMGKKEPELKEGTNFKGALLDLKDAKDDWLHKTQGWLDIDNCLFFFTDFEMFDRTKMLFFEAPKEVKAK